MSRSFTLRLGTFWLLAAILAHPDSPADFPPVASSPYRTEQEWIISSICRDAFEQLAYDKDKKGEVVPPEHVVLKQLPGAELAYDVTVHGAQATAEAEIKWPDSIWSPAAYVPFCQAAAQALKLPPSASAEIQDDPLHTLRDFQALKHPPAPASETQGNPLHTLLDFSENAIQTESHRITGWLATEPGNAAAHEQAAFVLGTLAMKENCGIFWDPREVCNRACSHLAVAKFLRAGAPVSVEGRLAECMIGLIVDTKTQTGRDLDQLAGDKKAASPDLTAWLSGARLRNTRDWRLIKNPENASPFEQVEYFRALADADNPDQAVSWLKAHALPNRIDWTRIVIEMDFSVEAGHIFAQNSIVQELHVMQATFPGSFTGAGLIADLNQSPDAADGPDAGAPSVVSRGLWARFFQRHFCEAIYATGDFFANKWGVPEDTQALDIAVQKGFSSLTSYPFLLLANQQLRSARADPKAALDLFRAHPELGPNFLLGINAPPGSNLARLRQAASDWFTPRILTGTAYAAQSRLGDSGVERALIDRLYAIAPLQYYVAEMELAQRAPGDHFTFRQISDVMGPLLDYYISAINKAKDATDITFDQRVKLAEKSAEIDPEGYFDLARLYQDQHQDGQAAVAYQQWFDHAPDRIEVSNGIEWLVDYDQDHGQADKALALAQYAADIYSDGGLRTLMHLLEKRAQFDQAEEYGKKIVERYNDTDPLIGFYKRRSDAGDAAFQPKFDSFATAAFPEGMKKVTLGSFSGPPDAGVRFLVTNDALRRNGLSDQSIIVGLDGYAIENIKEYYFVRAFSDSPVMLFIVWDGQAYREITANQPGRHFGGDMKDYHP